MSVPLECCVLSGGGLCDELITRPEESYQLWCVIVCDIENLMNDEPTVGFEPTISAGERPQTHALDRAATGTGH